MKTIGLTVLLCMAVTPAFAQYPEPAYPEASPSAAPAAWQQPVASPVSSSRAESRGHERHNGFHISIGGGFAGGGEEGRPGFATQFKIGYRLDADWVVFYYALNDWYRTSPPGAQWRIAAINGVGVDYFVVPRLGVRAAVGAGVNAPQDLFGTGKRHFGYSYVMGLTWQIGNDESHFSIDPAIHLLQTYSNAWSSENKQWRSDPYFLLTANWVLN